MVKSISVFFEYTKVLNISYLSKSIKYSNLMKIVQLGAKIYIYAHYSLAKAQNKNSNKRLKLLKNCSKTSLV